MELRSPPSPQKGISAILACAIPENKAKGATPPSAILSRKGIARYGPAKFQWAISALPSWLWGAEDWSRSAPERPWWALSPKAQSLTAPKRPDFPEPISPICQPRLDSANLEAIRLRFCRALCDVTNRALSLRFGIAAIAMLRFGASKNR